MAVTVFSCLNQGIEGQLVEVEVDILRGIPAFTIVGLGDAAVQEAKERIRSAIKNSRLEYPQQKKVINLAPAHLRKHGPHFDLPMAVGLLCASGQLAPALFVKSLVVGELALDGTLRPIRGALTMALFAKKNGWKQLILPAENLAEASLVEGLALVPLEHLRELFDLPKPIITSKPHNQSQKKRPTKFQNTQSAQDPLGHIYGNEQAKRALYIAAAGGHHLLFTGPPGVGKTMLAKALASLLPPLTPAEQLEVMQIYSSAGLLQGEKLNNNPKELVQKRPFRQVHAHCSLVALTGGGAAPKPGEISLAHGGVLFVDELPELPRRHIESLRQPLEEKMLYIGRSSGTIAYPARFTLIASMNPCPCGYFGDNIKPCTCKPHSVMQYQKKLSGPLLDRIDLVVPIERQHVQAYLQKSDLSTTTPQDASAASWQDVICKARTIQMQRLKPFGLITNSDMTPEHIKNFCALTPQLSAFFTQAAQRLSLSGRQYFQVLKVARTIADLAERSAITKQDLAEALQYRQAVFHSL